MNYKRNKLWKILVSISLLVCMAWAVIGQGYPAGLVQAATSIQYTVTTAGEISFFLGNKTAENDEVTLTYTVAYISGDEVGNNGLVATNHPTLAYPYAYGHGSMKFATPENIMLQQGYTYTVTMEQGEDNKISFAGQYTNGTSTYQLADMLGEDAQLTGEGCQYFGLYIEKGVSVTLTNVTCVDKNGNNLGLQSNQSSCIIENELKNIVKYEVTTGGEISYFLCNQKEAKDKVTLTYTVESTSTSVVGQNGFIATRNPGSSYPYAWGDGSMKFEPTENILLRQGYTYTVTMSQGEDNKICYTGSYTNGIDTYQLTDETFADANCSAADCKYFGLYIEQGVIARLTNVTCLDDTGNNLGLMSNQASCVITSGLNLTQYTQYSLIDAGVLDGIGSVSGRLISKEGTEVVGAAYDKAIFGAEVTFNTAQARMHYATGKDVPYGGIQIRLLPDSEKNGGSLILESYAGQLSYETVIIEPTQFGFTTFKQQEIQLQLTTDVVNIDNDPEANDVRLGIWINGKLANEEYVYILDQVASMGAYVNFNEANDTKYCTLWNLEAPRGDATYYEVSATKPYLVVADSLSDVTGQQYTNGDTVVLPGDYTAQYDASGTHLKSSTHKVVLWSEWDFHADGEINVADLVASKKADAKVELMSEAGQEAVKRTSSTTKTLDMRSYLAGARNDLPDNQVDNLYYQTDEQGLVMPIGAWIGPTAMAGYGSDGLDLTNYGIETDFLQDKYYQMIADLKINTLTYCDSDYLGYENKSILKGLQLAEKYNLKALVVDSGIADGTTDKNGVASRVKDYARYSSFVGLNVCDEPQTENFYYSGDHKLLSDIAGKAALGNGYTNLEGYVNLYPCYPDADIDAYKTYLTDYIEACKPKQLAYDYYLFWYGGGDESIKSCKNYFLNLETIRQKAAENDIPFSVYIGTGMSYRDEPHTTRGYLTAKQLKWNVNTALAYGAKGYNWFTLIEPWEFAMTGNSTDGMDGIDPKRCGLIGCDGSNDNENYEAAKSVNEWVSSVDHILMEAEWKAVLAYGNYAKSNTSASGTYGTASLRADNGSYGAIAGVFDYQGKTVYYIVNNYVDTSLETQEGQNITLEFSDGEKNMTIYNGTQVTTQKQASCTLNIAPGCAALVIVE